MARSTSDHFDYEASLKSEEWQQLRIDALEWALDRCQICNSLGPLHVHHRTYERVGCEDLADLTVLCAGCHEIFHQTVELLDTQALRMLRSGGGE